MIGDEEMNQKQFNVQMARMYAQEQKRLQRERKKLTEAHSEYLQRDIEEIYSALICVLFDSGCEREKIEELISAVANEWNYHVTHKKERGDISMADYCREHTGIDIRDSQYYEE